MTINLNHFANYFIIFQIKSIEFKKFNSKDIYDMNYIFYGCTSLRNLNLLENDINQVKYTTNESKKHYNYIIKKVYELPFKLNFR